MHLNVWNGEKEDYTKAKLIFVFLVTLYSTVTWKIEWLTCSLIKHGLESSCFNENDLWVI